MQRFVRLKGYGSGLRNWRSGKYIREVMGVLGVQRSRNRKNGTNRKMS